LQHGAASQAEPVDRLARGRSRRVFAEIREAEKALLGTLDATLRIFETRARISKESHAHTVRKVLGLEHTGGLFPFMVPLPRRPNRASGWAILTLTEDAELGFPDPAISILTTSLCVGRRGASLGESRVLARVGAHAVVRFYERDWQATDAPALMASLMEIVALSMVWPIAVTLRMLTQGTPGSHEIITPTATGAWLGSFADHMQTGEPGKILHIRTFMSNRELRPDRQAVARQLAQAIAPQFAKLRDEAVRATVLSWDEVHRGNLLAASMELGAFMVNELDFDRLVRRRGTKDGAGDRLLSASF
jgi:hypothetical protein